MQRDSGTFEASNERDRYFSREQFEGSQTVVSQQLQGSQTIASLHSRLKGPLGPVLRVVKEKEGSCLK